MKIVILDAKTLGDDIEFSVFNKLGDVSVYQTTSSLQLKDRIKDADIIIAAYGTTARIAKKSIKELRARGIKAGLLRPITLWPFPSEYFAKACGHAKCMLTVEMSCGQMVEDVRLAVNGRVPVDFYGRVGGMVPSWREIMEAAEKTLKGGKD